MFLKKVDLALSLKKRGVDRIEDGDHVLGSIKLLFAGVIFASAITLMPDLIGEA